MSNTLQKNTCQKPLPIFLISGQSGAGMSTALQVFEDIHFFTADGIPPSMVKEFILLSQKPDMQHFKGFALGLDIHSAIQKNPHQLEITQQEKDALLKEFLSSIESVKTSDQSIKWIYLEANNYSIIKRYATTRRPHPLEIDGLSLEAAITKERLLLEPIRYHADLIFDTSHYTLHDLRRAIQSEFYPQEADTYPMHINLLSFGFKYGLPQEADMVFDVRFLPNPYFVDSLRPLSGLDQEIVDYVFHDHFNKDFRDKLLEYLQFTLPYYIQEGRYKICLAIGCTGGRHRSVALCEYVYKELIKSGYTINLEHKHLINDTKQR